MTRALGVRTLVPIYLAVIVGVPLCLALVPVALAPTWPVRAVAVLLAAPLFAAAYVLTAGALSSLTLGAIVPGRVPRDVAYEIYGPRRLYALCWTSVCYCGPIYHAALAVPALRRPMLRLFGYRGCLDFQAYRDTWLRDLPLLTIGEGAYLSNKVTISPNMCLRPRLSSLRRRSCPVRPTSKQPPRGAS